MFSGQAIFAKKAGSAPHRSSLVLKSRTLRRKCACGGTLSPTGECEECQKKGLNSLHSRSGKPAPDASGTVYEALRSPGQPLDATTRDFSEARFGHDFSRVRVHTDSKAAKSARAVNALAYTVGNDVVFGANQYAPHAREGQRLLAHELTHTVQQEAKAPTAAQLLASTCPEDVGEREARDASDAVTLGNAVSVISQSGRQLARQENDENGGSPDAVPSDAGPADASLPGDMTTPADSESAQQSWTYEDSCGSFLDALLNGDDMAKDKVQKAIACLSVSPPPSWVDKALFDYFRISASNPNKADAVAAILGVYGQLSSHFNAGDYTYECNCHDCPDPSSSLGCSSAGEGPVTVCVANLAPKQANMPDVIVHEFSHRFAGTDDFSYCDPTCADLTPDKAIGNAASYELFASDAWGHTQSPSPSP